MVALSSKADILLQKYSDFLNPGLAKLISMMAPVIEEHASGMYVYDETGRKYLDLYAGHGVFNLGHLHPEVVSAVKKQLDKVALTASKIFLSEQMADLSELLAKITPDGMNRAFFVNSGTEAVEAALKLARAKTLRTKIIATENAFHGKTLGSLTATGRDVYKDAFKPLIPDVAHIEFGNLEALEAAIDDETAAFIVEPIQGEGGVNVPYFGYLKDAARITRDKGALLIVDEIQTGMGRTGKMFACEHEDVVPDIMTLAKALGGGVMPIGAIVATADAFLPFEENPFLHTSTFGGNPLACSAAIATIATLLREELALKAKERGEYLMELLLSIKNDYPDLIADVRGQGLLIGLEFANEGLVGHIIYELKLNGFLILQMLNNPRVIRIEPPLIISNVEIDMFIEALRAAIEQGKDLL